MPTFFSSECVALFVAFTCIAFVLEGCDQGMASISAQLMGSERQPSCNVQLSHVVASAAAYQVSDGDDYQKWRNMLQNDGWNLKNRYSKNKLSSNDAADLWIRSGECILAFRGSDDITDFIHDVMVVPVSFNGLQDVSSGVVDEFKPFLELILQDNQTVDVSCPNAFVVTGHSLGGAMAQLFSVLVNRQDDPLKWSRKVDALYTIGSMPISKVQLTNGQRPDGCFNGKNIFNANVDDGEDGTIYTDFAYFVPTAQRFKHVKREQVFVHSAGSRTFSCSEEVPSDKLKRVNLLIWKSMHGLSRYVDAVYRDATSSAEGDAWPPSVLASNLSCIS